MHAEYLLLLAGCLAITLPLEWIFRARVYRRPISLLLALLPMLVVFIAWDWLGIVRGHWWYESSRITGIELPGGMPLEEVLFFLVVPICGLLTLESVRWGLGALRRWRARRAAGVTRPAPAPSPSTSTPPNPSTSPAPSTSPSPSLESPSPADA